MVTSARRTSPAKSGPDSSKQKLPADKNPLNAPKQKFAQRIMQETPRLFAAAKNLAHYGMTREEAIQNVNDAYDEADVE